MYPFFVDRTFVCCRIYWNWESTLVLWSQISGLNFSTRTLCRWVSDLSTQVVSICLTVSLNFVKVCQNYCYSWLGIRGQKQGLLTKSCFYLKRFLTDHLQVSQGIRHSFQLISYDPNTVVKICSLGAFS